MQGTIFSSSAKYGVENRKMWLCFHMLTKTLELSMGICYNETKVRADFRMVEFAPDGRRRSHAAIGLFLDKGGNRYALFQNL